MVIITRAQGLFCKTGLYLHTQLWVSHQKPSNVDYISRTYPVSIGKVRAGKNSKNVS